jgi:hypothetical protein
MEEDVVAMEIKQRSVTFLKSAYSEAMVMDLTPGQRPCSSPLLNAIPGVTKWVINCESIWKDRPHLAYDSLADMFFNHLELMIDSERLWRTFS